jgi:Lrp/AsnC family transcriptional regulator for asnA, asnC and gidA
MRTDPRGSLARIRDVAPAASPRAALDDLDLSLLRLLAADGRASHRSLAAALSVSTPTVRERMARLERSGVIAGYGVRVDWAAMGVTESVYLSLTAGSGADVADIMVSLWAIPEVEHIDLVTGDLDLLVRLRVRDNDHLRHLLMNHIWQIEGMQRSSTMTSMATMPAKNHTAELLGHLRDGSPHH